MPETGPGPVLGQLISAGRRDRPARSKESAAQRRGGLAKTRADDGGQTSSGARWTTATTSLGHAERRRQTVWGPRDDGDNIVWVRPKRRQSCGVRLRRRRPRKHVWGTADGDKHSVGHGEDGDNIVWGTADDGGQHRVGARGRRRPTIVWGTVNLTTHRVPSPQGRQVVMEKCPTAKRQERRRSRGPIADCRQTVAQGLPSCRGTNASVA